MIQPANKSASPPVVHSSTRRSCDELGLCQHRTPACPGCGHNRHSFAPGVIHGHTTTPNKKVWRWVKWACFAALAIAAGVGAMR